MTIIVPPPPKINDGALSNLGSKRLLGKYYWRQSYKREKLVFEGKFEGASNFCQYKDMIKKSVCIHDVTLITDSEILSDHIWITIDPSIILDKFKKGEPVVFDGYIGKYTTPFKKQSDYGIINSSYIIPKSIAEIISSSDDNGAKISTHIEKTTEI